jgi:isopentenyl phosphate kinase
MILIKIGGSVITDKANGNKTVKIDLLRGLLFVVRDFLKENPQKIVLGHGAGSFGHDEAKKYLEIRESLSKIERIKCLNSIHESVMELHNIFMDNLNEIIEGHDGIEVVFGDVDLGGTIEIVSTENKILNKCKEQKLWSEKIILVTDQDGVYRNMKEKNNGIILDYNFDESNPIFEKAKDATGGMRQKVLECKKLLNFSDEVWIINGNNPERLRELLLKGSTYGTKVTNDID